MSIANLNSKQKIKHTVDWNNDKKHQKSMHLDFVKYNKGPRSVKDKSSWENRTEVRCVEQKGHNGFLFGLGTDSHPLSKKKTHLEILDESCFHKSIMAC